MIVSGSSKRFFLAVFAALVILHAFAVSRSRLLPFTDLPNHLAASTIVRHYGEFGTEFTKYFSVDLFPKPNVLYLVFCSAKIFPSVETASRVWYFLYALLLPLSVLLLTRRLGGALWPAVLSLLFLYSYSVCWGFAGYMMAIPLALFSAWASAGMAMKSGARYTAASAFLLLLIFFAHALAAIFAIVLHLVFMAFARDTRPMRKSANCLTAVPSLALLAAWWFYGRSFWVGPSTSEHLADYYTGEFFTAFPDRWKILFLDNYNVLGGTAGAAVGITFSLVVIAIAIIPLIRKRRGPAAVREEPGRPEGARYAFLLLALSFACYTFLPKDLPGQAILAQRFSGFVLLSLIIVAGIQWKGRRVRLVPAVATVVCLVHLVLWWSNFHSFNRENESFTADFFPDHWKGKMLSGLIYDFRWRGSPAYIHYPGYYITWKKGIATTSVIGYRFGIVRRKAPITILPAYLEWIGRFQEYDGRYSSLDYLLVRGTVPAEREHDTDGFEPLRAAGKWRLLKNH
jgi:ABC-type proline/glycine betaine transport system permease subunit